MNEVECPVCEDVEFLISVGGETLENLPNRLGYSSTSALRAHLRSHGRTDLLLASSRTAA